MDSGSSDETEPSAQSTLNIYINNTFAFRVRNRALNYVLEKIAEREFGGKQAELFTFSFVNKLLKLRLPTAQRGHKNLNLASFVIIDSTISNCSAQIH